MMPGAEVQGRISGDRGGICLCAADKERDSAPMLPDDVLFVAVELAIGRDRAGGGFTVVRQAI
jgi:hypothetical protein